MIYKNLYINLIIRIIILTTSILAMYFIYLSLKDIIVTMNILVVVIIQVALLIRYLNKLNEDLFTFFAAVRNDDSSIVYERMAPAKSFLKLYKCFDDVNNRIRDLKVESINRNMYLQNVDTFNRITSIF